MSEAATADHTRLPMTASREPWTTASVERAPRAYVTGEVQRPGPFRLERGMTVQQAVSAGGGLSLRGSNNGMKITRKDASGNPVTINVKADDPVQVDDVIVVRESWF